jgi:Ca2+-binding RTX toxin-like protein
MAAPVRRPAVIVACGAALGWAAPAAPGATVSVDASQTAVYRAAPGEANRLAVDAEPLASVATFRDTGAPIESGPGCNARADGTVACAGRRFVPYVQVDLGDGDDALIMHGGGMIAALGPGADHAIADRGRMQVEGGPGPDAISGRRGAEVEVDYYDHAVGVRVSLDGRANDGAPGEGDDVGAGVRSVDGTSHGDVLDARGAHGKVNFAGSSGNDRLYASPGGGFLQGSTGADILRGGRGRDLLRPSAPARTRRACSRTGACAWPSCARARGPVAAAGPCDSPTPPRSRSVAHASRWQWAGPSTSRFACITSRAAAW